MTIVRRRQNARFAALPNAIWEDDRLSIEAKGVLGYLLSRPANWHVRLPQVGKKLDLGKDRLQRIFRELIAAGYVTREQPRVASGAFDRFEYIVRDEAEDDDVAFLPQPGLPAPAEPVAAEPAPAEPAPGNQAAYINKTESTKTDFNKTELTKTNISKPLTPKPCPAPATSPAARAAGLSNEGRSRSERPEIVQSRLAARFGGGDIATGWELLGMLSPSHLDQVTAQERNGSLSDSEVARMIRSLVDAQTQPPPGADRARALA
ncbi:MAG: hypothetical protein ABIL01_16850 [Pseudomonadota bacterium]